ncbi:uracil-DNA glycosylase [Salmon gill poxvirus]|uniref:Uracil-DNA glycosylase n=1 Tax=Salmon gill poxvirus TaxID=1680908 RepID=A0A0H4XWN3_9POXV|nr:uracil-DNA glycosylase [Salmon gill poxvirus]AKR04258.1 uracil-DNA glycosylase [Salmon gill poxvirus]WMX26540.1 uracil-DNA glycosylase [Salmon gill poxvirus]
MKTFTISVPPYKFKYHDDWAEILPKMMQEYSVQMEWILSENPAISESIESEFKIFTKPYKNKKVLFVVPEPSKTQRGYLPLCSDNISSDKYLEMFVKKLCTYLKVPMVNKIDAFESPDVFVWNCAFGSDNKEKWKDFTCIMLNHVQLYISVFCFLRNTGINRTQDLTLKKTCVVQAPSMFNGYDKISEWESNDNKTFEIIDTLLRLKFENFQMVSWDKSLS